jgi:phosphoribosyl 1,2-cyclic phosphate phosphodiesterase
LKVTFLGTGTSQGIPVIGCRCEVCRSKDPRDKRLRSSIWLEVSALSIVIDSGPDFREQMLRHDISKLDALLLTHEHRDHTAGLDDVRGFNFNTNKPVDVYATTQTQAALQRDFQYIFSGVDYPGIPRIALQIIGDEPFRINDVEIVPITVMHHKMPVTGFRIHDFTYITDANFIDETGRSKIKGSRVVVLNALRKAEHVSHFTLDQAIEIAHDLGAETTYFTHASHQLGMHEAVDRTLPAGMSLAFDDLELQL